MTPQEVQQIAQQAAEQAVQQVIEQVVQGSSQERFLSGQDKFEEINSGEAFRRGVYNDAEAGSFNKKLLLATELKEKELAIAERESKLRKQAALDAIEISERENSALIKHLANTLLVDFRTAAYHPISPNDSDTAD